MPSTVDYRDTLVTYLRSETVEDAARNLGITTQNLSVRLTKMRKAGVNIPRKKAPDTLNSDLFVAQLNSLVRKYVKENN